MSIPNSEWIQKADLTLASISAGGKLQAEQELKFYNIGFNKSVLLKELDNKRMNSDTWELSRSTPDDIVLQPGLESTALAQDERSGMSFDKVTLTVVKLMGECRWSYEIVEDNIQNGTFDQLVIGELAEKVMANVEELVISGDTAIVIPAKGSTAESITAWKRARLLKQFDGIIKKSTSNVLNAGGVRLNKNVLKAMWQTMPSPFKSNNLAFYTHENAVTDYHDSIADRQTPAGDAAFQETGNTKWQGKWVKQIPLWPNTFGSNANLTKVAVFNPKNIVVGWHRNITLEREPNIRSQEYVAVWSMRVGMQIIHVPSCGLIENVLGNADI